MFILFFAALLLAIAANRIDRGYYVLAPEGNDKACSNILLCQVIRPVEAEPPKKVDEDNPAEVEVAHVKNELHNFFYDQGICQLFSVKSTAAVYLEHYFMLRFFGIPINIK